MKRRKRRILGTSKEEKTQSLPPIKHCKLFLFLFSTLTFENDRDFVRAIKEIKLSGDFQGILKVNSP